MIAECIKPVTLRVKPVCEHALDEPGQPIWTGGGIMSVSGSETVPGSGILTKLISHSGFLGSCDVQTITINIDITINLKSGNSGFLSSGFVSVDWTGNPLYSESKTGPVNPNSATVFNYKKTFTNVVQPWPNSSAGCLVTIVSNRNAGSSITWNISFS